MAFELPESTDDLTIDDLWRLTNSLIDDVKTMLRRCVDADVIFVPVDPAAHDAAAASEADANIAWTLGHIIVHMTASSEESAALASELARGVEYHGRSRSEVPWTAVTTVAQCRTRLEESRRMRLASLSLWPDEPYYANTYESRAGATPLGPVARFVSGLRHDAGHLAQLRDVIGQARDYRFRQTLLGRLRRRLRGDQASVAVDTDPNVAETSETTAR